MKCAGSKERIASDIVTILNSYILLNNIDTYIEPFVGGANIIDKIQCSKKLAYDKNRYLIALYKHLQVTDVLPLEITRETYLDCKAHFHKNDKFYPDWYLALCGILMNTSTKMYEGTYIKNTASYEYYKGEKEKLLEQMKSLMDTKFGVSDYTKLKPENTLVYCDAPYCKSKGFDGVSREFNYKQYWNIIRQWSKNNIVIVSEIEAPEDFDIIWQERYDDSNNIEKLFIHHSLNNDEDISNF